MFQINKYPVSLHNYCFPIRKRESAQLNSAQHIWLRVATLHEEMGRIQLAAKLISNRGCRQCTRGHKLCCANELQRRCAVASSMPTPVRLSPARYTHTQPAVATVVTSSSSSSSSSPSPSPSLTTTLVVPVSLWRPQTSSLSKCAAYVTMQMVWRTSDRARTSKPRR